MPAFQYDPRNPKAEFFNSAVGGSPSSPGHPNATSPGNRGKAKIASALIKKNKQKKYKVEPIVS